MDMDFTSKTVMCPECKRDVHGIMVNTSVCTDCTRKGMSRGRMWHE